MTGKRGSAVPAQDYPAVGDNVQRVSVLGQFVPRNVSGLRHNVVIVLVFFVVSRGCLPGRREGCFFVSVISPADMFCASAVNRRSLLSGFRGPDCSRAVPGLYYDELRCDVCTMARWRWLLS